MSKISLGLLSYLRRIWSTTRLQRNSWNRRRGIWVRTSRNSLTIRMNCPCSWIPWPLRNLIKNLLEILKLTINNSRRKRQSLLDSTNSKIWYSTIFNPLKPWTYPRRPRPRQSKRRCLICNLRLLPTNRKPRTSWYRSRRPAPSRPKLSPSQKTRLTTTMLKMFRLPRWNQWLHSQRRERMLMRSRTHLRRWTTSSLMTQVSSKRSNWIQRRSRTARSNPKLNRARSCRSTNWAIHRITTKTKMKACCKYNPFTESRKQWEPNNWGRKDKNRNRKKGKE